MPSKQQKLRFHSPATKGEFCPICSRLLPPKAQQKGKSIQAAALTARAQALGPPYKHSSADEDVMQQVCLARDKKQEASKADILKHCGISRV